MRKLIAVLLMLVLVLLGAGMSWCLTSEGQDLNNLARAFAASQAALLEINMNGWARATTVPQSIDQLVSRLRRASLAAFGMYPPEITSWAEGGTIFAYASFVTAVYAVDANVQTISHGGTHETYLVLTLKTAVPGYSIDSVESTLHAFFLAVGLRPTVTTCFIGVLAGQLSSEEAAMVVARVLGALRAETQEFFSDGHGVNLVGYSRELPRGVKMAGRHSNWSLMLRFDPENNITHIWLATPTLSLSI
ncbi:MAG: YwmB family TATA-box binding protein [Peptococcaceae bacterium]|nr:YwmB family TATA-box binding protein [Peptococcaceae bacterium]